MVAEAFRVVLVLLVAPPAPTPTMAAAPLDVIRVSGIRVDCVVGVNPGERVKLQPVVVALALFVDTYNNNPGRDSRPHPYISLMLNDGTLARDHDGSGTHSALHAPAGCSAQLRQVSSAGQERVLTLRLAYSGAERRVRASYLVTPSAYEHVGRPEADWTQCFDVSNVDLEL